MRFGVCLVICNSRKLEGILQSLSSLAVQCVAIKANDYELKIKSCSCVRAAHFDIPSFVLSGCIRFTENWFKFTINNYKLLSLIYSSRAQDFWAHRENEVPHCPVRWLDNVLQLITITRYIDRARHAQPTCANIIMRRSRSVQVPYSMNLVEGNLAEFSHFFSFLHITFALVSLASFALLFFIHFYSHCEMIVEMICNEYHRACGEPAYC